MLVSPADFIAFSQATGAPYPSSPAAKAQILPILLDWKAAQQQEQTENRGPNLLAAALAGAGTIGLGAGAYGIYQKLRKQGISEPVAAEIAQKQAATPPPPPPVSTQRLSPEQIAAQINLTQADTPVSAAPDGNFTGALFPGNRRGTAEARGRGEYNNNSLWNDSNWAPLLHAANTPELQQSLVAQVQEHNSPLARRLKDAISQRNGSSDSPPVTIQSAADLPSPRSVPENAAFFLESENRLVVPAANRNGWVDGSELGARSRLASSDSAAYGSVSTSDLDGNGNPIDINAPKAKTNKKMLQEGYFPPGQDKSALIPATEEMLKKGGGAFVNKGGYLADRETGRPLSILDPKAKKGIKNWNVKLSDLVEPELTDEQYGDSRYKARLDESDPLKEYQEYLPATSEPRTYKQDQYAKDHGEFAGGGMRSATAYENGWPASFQQQTGTHNGESYNYYKKVPQVDANGRLIPEFRGRANDTWMPDAVEPMIYAGTTSKTASSGQAISDAEAFYQYYIDRKSDKRFSIDNPNQPKPHVRKYEDTPYIQSEIGGSAPAAAQAYAAQVASGTADQNTLVKIARDYGVAPGDIETAASRMLPPGEKRLWAENLDLGGSGYKAPAARAVGGKTVINPDGYAGDWLTQALSAMRANKPADSHTINHLLASPNPADRAKAAQSWLGANQELAQVFSSQMPGTSTTERLSLVQEALNDAADDYQRAISWAATNDPELAPRLTPGAKGFPSFDQFARPYVRKHVLGSALELSNAGGGAAPVINLPADVAEIIANEAITSRVSPDEIINQRIAGAKSPVEAVWKLDGILGNAASSNLDEPYTTGSKLAERFWDAAPPDDKSRVGRLKARLGETTQSRLAAGNPLEGPNAAMPVAIKFASRFKGIDKLDQASADQLIDAYINEPITRTTTDGKPLSPATTAFPDNRAIANEVKFWNGEINKNAKLFKDGLISAEQNNAIQAEAKQKVQQLKGQQQSINSLRTEGEQLISASNRSTANGLGRGYVLDLHPKTKNAIAVPDFSVTPTSLDLPSGESELNDLAPQDLRNEVARQQALNSGDASAAIDLAAAPGSDTARQYGARVESMSPGEAEPMLAELKRQRLNRAEDLRVQQLIEKNLGQGGTSSQLAVRLSATELEQSFNAAKARLRAITAQPTTIGTIQSGTPLPPARTGPQPRQPTPLQYPDQTTRKIRSLESGDMHLFPDGTAAAVNGSRPDFYNEKKSKEGDEITGYEHSSRRFQLAPEQVTQLTTPAQVEPGQLQGRAAPVIKPNTLQPTAVGNGVNEQALTAARNQHLADYITSVATAGHDKAGRQTRGWAGGDSYQGGARLAGPAKNNPAAYVPPSPALQQLLARTALRRVAS